MSFGLGTDPVLDNDLYSCSNAAKAFVEASMADSSGCTWIHDIPSSFPIPRSTNTSPISNVALSVPWVACKCAYVYVHRLCGTHVARAICTPHSRLFPGHYLPWSLRMRVICRS